MDQNGGADAIAIARSVRELARRKVYVVAVRRLPRVHAACQHSLDINPETPCITHDHTLDMSCIQPKQLQLLYCHAASLKPKQYVHGTFSVQLDPCCTQAAC